VERLFMLQLDKSVQAFSSQHGTLGISFGDASEAVKTRFTLKSEYFFLKNLFLARTLKKSS
jgi:hypothetical protein